MRHDDDSALAKGRFFAKIDQMVNEVCVVGSSCGDGVLPVPVAGSLLKNNLRSYLPAEDEEGDGVVSPVELMGDWSWRPEMQVKDPGYTFSADEMAEVNDALELSDAFDTPREKGLAFALKLVPPRPWLVTAHVGMRERPPRINCIR